MSGVDFENIVLADVEAMIYNEWMRPPQFKSTAFTWQETCTHADDEMKVLRAILASDVMLLHNDTAHRDTPVDVARLPSMARYTRSCMAYFFGIVRQITVRRQINEAMRGQCSLYCTEHLDDEIDALEQSLAHWTDDIESMITCDLCRLGAPVLPPASPGREMHRGGEWPVGFLDDRST